MLVDTHIHLDSSAYEGDLPAVIERAKAAGLGGFIIPGADLATLERAAAIAEHYDEVYFASGVHPYDLAGLLAEGTAGAGRAGGADGQNPAPETAAQTPAPETAAQTPAPSENPVFLQNSAQTPAPETAAATAGENPVFLQNSAQKPAPEQSLDISSLLAQQQDLPQQFAERLKNFNLQLLGHPKCCAIGECGLDYFRKPSPAEKRAQQIAFARHCEIACENDLPIILHVRDASEDVAAILREFPALRGVFHCFNASALLLEFSERFYYGIGGVLTFKNARALVQILPRVPLERLLIETDGPYLTPHPHRGSRNESAYCTLVRDKICEILGKNADEIEQISSQNARDLFHI